MNYNQGYNQPPQQGYPQQQGFNQPPQQQGFNQPPQQQGFNQPPQQQGFNQPPGGYYQPPPSKTPKQVVSKLQYSINYYKIDLGQLFSAYKQNFSANMQYNEFSALLLKIDPTLQPNEIQMTFQYFDKDGDRTLSFQEFDQQLNGMKQRGEQMMKGEQTLKQLKYSIDYYKIDLQQLFAKYDTTRNNTIDKMEFGNLIRKINPQAQQQDIDAAFIYLDSDQSGFVNQFEFVTVLNQVQSGYYQGKYAPPQQQQYPQQQQQGFNQPPQQQGFNQPPQQQGFNQPPQQQGFNQPPQQGYNQSIPPQQGFNQSIPPQQGYNQSIPPQQGFNQSIPPQQQQFNQPPQQYGNQYPNQQQFR